jgi:hypothetical protein
MNDPGQRGGLIGRKRELGAVAALLNQVAERGQAQVCQQLGLTLSLSA